MILGSADDTDVWTTPTATHTSICHTQASTTPQASPRSTDLTWLVLSIG